MKMNKLRLTNKIENHFYLDFNWKDRNAASSVSQRFFGLETRFSYRDTDATREWSVSWQRKNTRRNSHPVLAVIRYRFSCDILIRKIPLRPF